MNLKRLEGIGMKSLLNQRISIQVYNRHHVFLTSAKSPVYTHLSATLNGLSTIRAFKSEEILENEFDNHQDTHTACLFLFIATNAAFGFVLDVMCNLFIACIMGHFLFVDKNVPGEKVGLAITQAMTLLGILRHGVIQCAGVIRFYFYCESLNSKTKIL